MKIKDIKFYILEGEPKRRQAKFQGAIEKVSPGLSGLFTHSRGLDGQDPHGPYDIGGTLQPTYAAILRLVTDGGLDAYTEYFHGFNPEDLEWQGKRFKTTFLPLLIDVDAFDREYIWQRLWYAQRFLYTGRRPLDVIDQILWDFASRYAKLPLYKLLGGCREKIPAYRSIHGSSIDELVADAVRVKQEGFKGAKDHSYRGVTRNIELARELREAVGDDFLLMHAPTGSYTFTEAVKVGRALEQFNYAWMEEPLRDFDFMGLKKLSDTLDLPILALEWKGGDVPDRTGQPFSVSAFLAMKAVDMVRQRGIGITGQMKLAQLAESFGVDVHGGDPHVALATQNDPLFEADGMRSLPLDAPLTFQGTLTVDEGYMSIVCADHPVEEPDWDEIEKTAVAVV